MTTQTQPTYEERFWQKVDRRGDDDCWEWRGARHGKGYGLFGHRPERRAHRISYVLEHGPIADGLWVLHQCDNPSCVNPAHLFLGTAKDNTQDSIAKGRYHIKRGNAVHGSKLDEESVRHIRAVHIPYSHEFGAAALARKFGVNVSNIHTILSGKAWRHV